MSAERWAVRETAWGDHEPEPVLLAMGPWRIELRGDELADVSFDGAPIVRSVRAVVRDRDWNTVPAVVESIDVLADGCDVRLSMRGLGADIHAILEVRADATRLAVRLVATSHTRFASNRLGLVVLHPPAAAGADLVIGTASGGERRTLFPVAVSPHQPAMEIRSLAWTLDGVTTTATFDGEVFEMEDQRNWTDASYKTYSTPLERPFPVDIPAGAVIGQSVAFESTRVAPGTASDATTDTGVVELELVDTGRPVPGLVLGASTVPDTAFTVHELPAGVAGILVELDTRTASWRAALDRAALESAGLPLDIRIVADSPDAVYHAVDAAAAAGPVARLAVFAGRGHMTEPELWAALTDAAARTLPTAGLLGGARSHFTELNRRHGDLPRDLPALAFSMTPQMHAVERAQLVESIAMQALVVRDAARLAAGRPLYVGPITLRPRFNAVATGTASSPADPTLTAGYGAELVAGATDARQSSAALAAWTVASFAAISTADLGDGGLVADIAYFETIGPRGIRDDSGAFPVALAVEMLASLAGGRLLAPREAAPDGIQVVGSARADGSWRALVASLADRRFPLVLRYGGRTLERDLAPYQVVVIDSADR